MDSEGNTQSLKAYLWYLKNVLGISEVIFPEVSLNSENAAGTFSKSVSPENTSKEKKILFIDSESWSPEALQLFEKMRHAMGLSAADIDLYFGELDSAEFEIKKLIYQDILIFSDAGPTGPHSSINLNSGEEQHRPYFQTYSPRVLLVRPELKRSAWEDLKRLMARWNLKS